MKNITRYFSFIGQVDCIETNIHPTTKELIYEVSGDNWSVSIYNTLHKNIVLIVDSYFVQDWDRETLQKDCYWETECFLAKKTGFYINPAVPVEKFFFELESALSQ